jgi:proteasome lid subunit RPN8/RPN11
VDSEAAPHFILPGASWILQFSEQAASFMNSHRQKRWHQPEAVGQLFSPDLTCPTIRISEATVLTRVKASRASVTFDPDEAAEQRTLKLRDGLHCVGIWHTHPEITPKPSGTDERLAADHASAARSVLNGLCFVIVGTGISPESWYVGIHDGKVFHAARRPLSPKGSKINSSPDAFGPG